ncbi:MAG TPA: sugar phosphate isomerase/epimerase [Candidatus Latescibacteria bacterium]|nr:sugar phosphate isomerase/epimerase [Candidatus Handelsmanbacteria bacterium]HIL07104.1 sugar phosphate isomerase/epimerase [Candidatus Latescibacterota bacterium]
MKFQVYQSYWGMSSLPFGGEEWSMEEKLAKIAEAGFDGVEWLMEEKEHREAMVPLCDKYNLQRSNIVFPWTPDEFEDDIQAAKDGGASHINLQPMPMPRLVAHGVSYLVRCMDMAAAAGYELFIETHRDRMTTDMYFTLDLIDAVPDMVLCGDLSHFLVGREFSGPPLSEQNQIYMEQILARCGAFHGRVASREQVQVPINFPHNKVWLDLYASWWEYGFRQFKERSGEDDVLTFVVELGPPTYAMQGADGQELSDRWAEAVQMKDLVREIWARC